MCSTKNQSDTFNHIEYEETEKRKNEEDYGEMSR